MSAEDRDIVKSCECLFPTQELLEVHVEDSRVRLAYHTAHIGCHSVELVSDGCSTSLVNSESGIEGECEVLKELDFCECSAVECITFSVVLVDCRFEKCV